MYVFAEAVLSSTHNACFGSKIRRLGIPLQTLVFFYIRIKVELKGVYMTRTCFPDVNEQRKRCSVS